MSIEAMKQALEALEGIHPGNMTPMAEEYWNKAITALRTAIEQAEKQEPVAWGFQNTAITGSNRWMMLREKVPANDQYGGALWTPLYTHPQPKREWVGLTNEEIEALAGWWPMYYQMPAIKVLVKDVEAKLKEKNYGAR